GDQISNDIEVMASNATNLKAERARTQPSAKTPTGSPAGIARLCGSSGSNWRTLLAIIREANPILNVRFSAGSRPNHLSPARQDWRNRCSIAHPGRTPAYNAAHLSRVNGAFRSSSRVALVQRRHP